MPTHNTHSIASAIGALSLVAVAFLSGVGAVSVLDTINRNISNTASVAHAFPTTLSVDPASLTAKAAIVYDPTTHQVLYEKNAYTSLPIASLAKLVTATAILDRVIGNPTITITKDDLVQNGAESDADFVPGNRIKLHDLLEIGLIASSNSAMQAAARMLGTNYTDVLQATAFGLGIKDMEFHNGTGLDVTTSTAGAYGSAYDIALIAANFAKQHPEYFNLTQKPDVTIPAGWGGTISAHATNLPLQDMPGLIGAKTGYTDLAGGNIVALFDLEVGHPIVIAVLGSTQTARFTDTELLLAAARATLSASKNHTQ
ncbi:hypothetical protein A2419_02390 [Candidatus Adlerbacteria bacterium RIFOXYC1_FULL_48_26]|uniref:Peptidase S11 D-alanyl-D-alanine carboxypeptidase A N-terminal domain-containing protein n=1 Tax=Candidatus Adlerbacteria bacterium RIFOXYC1_FULL_48_26 TaxID=1797247 RepID=A0A1F4Y4Q3_9BACT|nr:MAG: hypothetical protein A2419_02390 [Candidatus Adlerbacteria bacterium RIFOXYC1_FULL_48_26]OGC96149.1 MAG: hypothetical protein A2590_01565 [Candidatus Adlerbacteria bacterium RIFOXYD1_FULL_48_8]